MKVLDNKKLCPWGGHRDVNALSFFFFFIFQTGRITFMTG